MSPIALSMAATGGRDGVRSGLIASGCGARPLAEYDEDLNRSPGVDKGWMGRGSDPHVAGHLEAGVLRSPEILENGLFR